MSGAGRVRSVLACVVLALLIASAAACEPVPQATVPVQGVVAPAYV